MRLSNVGPYQPKNIVFPTSTIEITIMVIEMMEDILLEYDNFNLLGIISFQVDWSIHLTRMLSFAYLATCSITIMVIEMMEDILLLK